MRVGDQVAVVDLDRLHPVRMIPDNEVGAVVDCKVADLPGGVGSNPGACDRHQFVLLTPVEGDHNNIGLGPYQVDLALHLGTIDVSPNTVEAEEGELEAADNADLVG